MKNILILIIPFIWGCGDKEDIKPSKPTWDTDSMVTYEVSWTTPLAKDEFNYIIYSDENNNLIIDSVFKGKSWSKSFSILNTDVKSAHLACHINTEPESSLRGSSCQIRILVDSIGRTYSYSNYHSIVLLNTYDLHKMSVNCNLIK